MMGPDASWLSIFDGSDQAVAPLSTEQLPEANGFAGRKFFGIGSRPDGSIASPPLYVFTEGGFSGTLDVDTQLRVRYRFTVTTDAPALQWLIDGTVNTSNGAYTNALIAGGGVTSGQEISGWFPLLKGNTEPVIAAGTVLDQWFLSLTLIDPGSPGRYNVTLDIAEDTFEISSYGVDRGVPEPGTVALLVVGMVGVVVRRRF